MHVEADLTTQDYDAFLSLATRRATTGVSKPSVRVRFWLLLTLSFILWIALGFSLPFFSEPLSASQVFSLYFVYVLLAFFWGRHTRRAMSPEHGGTVLGPHTFSLTPEGIEDRGSFSSTLTQWPAVQAVEETPEHLFLFIDTTVAHIIPKRCFTQPEDYDAFLQELQAYLPSSCRIVEAITSPRVRARRQLSFAALILLTVFLSSLLLAKIPRYLAHNNQEEATENTWSKEWEEGEDLLYSQTALVEQQTAAMLPQRPGVVDSYFVGFGSDADQDVFMKEALYAQQVFDRQYDTRGRSIALVNNAKTKKDLPLASLTNLRTTLRSLGKKLNREEDILFLFLTSHGSRDHLLSVDYWPLPLRELSSTALADILKESGIKWRVILISACYSGGFIDNLKNDQTLIITSASATRTSFGCGEEDELTYFGRAFLQDQLEHGIGLLQAFSGATSLIRQREAERKLKASNPQISSPPAILQKLKKLEARLETTKPHG